jgi:hypothetical protein
MIMIMTMMTTAAAAAAVLLRLKTATYGITASIPYIATGNNTHNVTALT